MYWPGAGNDPFYLYNPTDNVARKNYYGITGTPSMKCDGVLSPYPNTANLQSSYNQRSAVDSPVSISLNISVGVSINVDIAVNATTSFSGSGLKFHTVLMAERIDTSGAGWYQTHYKDIMLLMAPTANGQTFNISPGQTVNLTASFPIPSITILENLAVIGFVQNDASREILNAKYAQILLGYPCLTISDYTLTDNIGGEPNGIPEPGETCELWVELYNMPPFAAAANVTGSLSTTDPDIEINNGGAVFPDIPTNSTGSNEDNPFVFTVSQELIAHNVTFRLDISADEYQTTQFLTLMVGTPPILLVDDDADSAYEAAFETNMTNLGYQFNVWEVSAQGAPTAAYLCNFQLVIWHTGMAISPFTQDEQDAVAGFLDHGGKLFMSSENISDQLTGTPFFTCYFHAQHNSYLFTTNLTGFTGNPISGGTTLGLFNGAYWPDSQSSIIPDSLAVQVYKYNNPAASIAALYYYQGDYALSFR